MQKSKRFLSWSGGKDSMMALYKANQQTIYEIASLLSNIDTDHKQVQMHGVGEELIVQQAASLHIPLDRMYVPFQPDIKAYEQAFSQQMIAYQQQGIQTGIFGDLFLEDLKTYRESQLQSYGMEARFPLWKYDTRQLIREFIDLGFKAVIVCADAEKLPKDTVGSIIDLQWLDQLPTQIDPCGENGEFHTFVFDGPMFQFPISYHIQNVYNRTYARPSNTQKPNKASKAEDMSFWMCDITLQI